MRIEFRKPGATNPYLVAHERRAGLYGENETAPLAWQFRVNRGNFCGDGSLTLSRPPVGMQAGDWVQFWFGNEPDPVYLGFVHSPVWKAGKGEIILKSPLYFVEMCAWASVIGAGLQPQWDELPIPAFLSTILSRCTLPAGIRAGNLGSSPAVARARTDFELLRDTFSGLKPALEGGEIGVDARGRINVYEPQEIIRHRFPRQFSERPPGSYDGYANSVLFPYVRPDGSTVNFRFEDSAEKAAGRGALYLTEQLPSIVGASYTSIPADTPTTLNVKVGYDFSIPARYVTHTASSTLGTVSANGLVFAADGTVPVSRPASLPATGPYDNLLTASCSVPDSQYQFSAIVTLEVYTSIPIRVSGARLQPVDGKVRVELSTAFPVVAISYDAADVDAAGGPQNVPYPMWGNVTARFATRQITWDENGNPSSIIYTNVPGWVQFNGMYSISNVPGRIFVTWQQAVSVMDQTGLAGVWDPNNKARFTATPPKASMDAEVELKLSGGLRTWLEGSRFEANMVNGVGPINAVKVKNSATGEVTPLIGPFPMYGSPKLSFSFPKDITGDTVLLTGDLRKFSGLDIRGVNHAPLIAYAKGLLRYRIQPVRRWSGRYNDLKTLDARDLASFETDAGTEEVLDVQSISYDSQARRPVVEAGTPLAVDLSEAVERSAYNLEQRIRAVKG